MTSFRHLQWPLLLIAAAAYIYFPVYSLWSAGLSSNDFKHIFLGMKAILDGSSPYGIQPLHHQAALQGYRQISLNPYVYLPFTGHAMAFLAPLRLDQAVFTWFILNHIFSIISLYLLSRLFPASRTIAFAIMLLSFAFSAPFFRTLSAGQLNMALLLLITLGWSCLKSGRVRISGAILAFAALFKLMPGLFGLCFLLRRQWQAALSMLIAGAILLTLSMLLAGPQMYLDFIPVVQQMGYGKSTWPEFFSFWDDPANQSLNSFFSHIFTINSHTSPWINLGQSAANAATMFVTVILVLVYALLLLKTRATRSSSSRQISPIDEAAFASTLILALLIPSLLWDHYLVMLILPVAIMTSSAILMKRFATAGLVVICYGLTCLPWNFESTAWQTGAGILLMSAKLWPTLVLFGLSLCFIRWSVEIVTWADEKAPENS